MSESPIPRRRLAIGPSADGLWIVRDENGVCGAVFNSRDEALNYARAECEAAGGSEWRLVSNLDMAAIFAPAAG